MTITETEVGAGRWEYAHLEIGTNKSLGGGVATLTRALNDLGVEGWQLVTLDDVDRTFDVNTYVAMLRRQLVPLPDPADLTEGWYADPSGRCGHRYWNGRTWTFHVSDGGNEYRDPPTLLAPLQGFTQ